ncbi:phage tail terminator-like protein [Kluyvera ascorbata]|uniref:phage tail terminator-like protein n=1 Tax=Kluyvera ascorbata TaxID=51288 RepID=UPI002AB8BFA9|nr:phage tail terminator-like protein [Kluyvera ascorbata]MDZ4033867.1 phage tail terminator-like protein [Kluyvera ascorbata]
MASDQSMRIAELLESRIAVICSSLGLPVAWPNIAFEPPDAPYARVYVLPAQTVGQDLEGQLRTYQGILQVNIIAPAGSGVNQARGLALSIADAFPEGLPLVDGDLTVYINGPPQIRSPIQDRPTSAPNGSSGSITYTIPISMQYRADY